MIQRNINTLLFSVPPMNASFLTFPTIIFGFLDKKKTPKLALVVSFLVWGRELLLKTTSYF